MERRLSRRQFASLSAGGLAAMAMPKGALADALCSQASAVSSVPNVLVVSCASRTNFKLFRRYSDYVGLAGLVCVKPARGVHGTFETGAFILYPWLKPAGQKSRAIATNLRASCPTGASSGSLATKLVPNAMLPQDEYVCRYLLQAPWQNFIGFSVDVPAKRAFTADFVTSVPKLADGLGAEITWSSANLNAAQFGGGHVIPSGEACNGAVWRKLIVTALNQASASAC